MTDIQDLKDDVESFLEATLDARNASQRDRDFYSGHQWSDSELAALKKRHQVPVTVNRIKPKTEGLKGLLENRKTDIKAFPRNQSDEEAAHAVTDALRYVADNSDFDNVSADVFEDQVVEGYGAAIVQPVRNAKGETEIMIQQIPWDRFYFDPHSRKKDFTDAQYMGQIIWLDEKQLKRIFKGVNISELSGSGESNNGWDETQEDRPQWVLEKNNRKRFRIAQHFFLDDKGVWNVAYFSGNTYLEKPQESPYLDEDGDSTCPIVAQTAYIDRENNRFGEVRAFIDLQREVNHRRSKALHLLSSRQTIATRGAVDVKSLKRELAKPDGHVEIHGDTKKFEVVPTNDFTQGQLALYQDAKEELDAQSVNAQLSGERSSGDLSGKAIDRLQSAGSLEVSSLFKGHSHFKKRVFRQVFASIKQYWDKEKWIRITDDQDSLKWTGLNHEVTVQEFLENIINDDSKPEMMRKGAAQQFTQMMQAQDPALGEIVEVKNNVAELDVDIILEESQDVVNLQQEQFAILAQFAQSSNDIDIIELIELSNLRNKKEIVDKIETRRKAAAEAAGGAQQMQQEEAQVKNAKTYAEAQLTEKKAEQMAIENATLVTRPDDSPQVNA